MEGDRALGLMNELLWNTMLVAGPVLAAALVVGLAISVLQVATQLQEMTLSYVPKLLASAIVLLVLGPCGGWSRSRARHSRSAHGEAAPLFFDAHAHI
jgi:flagellar biosynthetic protein FliQ